MSTLERAICIAARAHEGQLDKAGAPYVLHPLRLMIRVTTEEERLVAVLHDVVEDSDWTLEDLRDEGFSNTVIAALECVTRRAGEPYTDFIRRASRNPIARSVKIADLEDNMDLTRIESPTERDHERMRRYAAALEMLCSAD